MRSELLQRIQNLLQNEDLEAIRKDVRNGKSTNLMKPLFINRQRRMRNLKNSQRSLRQEKMLGRLK